MKKTYMEAYEELLQKRVSSKKEKLKAIRTRPNRSLVSEPSVIFPSHAPEPKPKLMQVKYIDKVVDIMHKSDQALQIDNDYGDYAMSIFRKKDKIKRLEDIPRLFTSDFKTKLLDCFPAGCEKLIDGLIKGKVKAADLLPQPKAQPPEERLVYRRNPSKNLKELSSSMQYEYSPEKEESEQPKFNYMNLFQKEETMRANSMDRMGERRQSHFLPHIKNSVVKKGLIFKGQPHHFD